MPEGMVGYEEDLFLWSQQQAKALRDAARRGVNLPVDWENIAEEIESLGRRDRTAIVSRLETIVVHLLKLEHSSMTDPRRGWIVTVERNRQSVQRLLDESPSLRARLPELVAQALVSGVRPAVSALETVGEYEAAHLIERAGVGYSAEQVMGDWIPPGPLDP
jgi:hypothetical protein